MPWGLKRYQQSRQLHFVTLSCCRREPLLDSRALQGSFRECSGTGPPGPWILCLRLMHRNPVARGLVERPEDWAWSSFRHYLTGEEGVVEIESQVDGAGRENMGYAVARATDRNPHPEQNRLGWGTPRSKMRLWARASPQREERCFLTTKRTTLLRGYSSRMH